MIDAVDGAGGHGEVQELVEELVEVGGAVVAVPDDPPTELRVLAAVCFVDDVCHCSRRVEINVLPTNLNRVRNPKRRTTGGLL